MRITGATRGLIVGTGFAACMYFMIKRREKLNKQKKLEKDNQK